MIKLIVEPSQISISWEEFIKTKPEFSTKDIWGGGDLIGGSPRVSGSKLKPEQVEEIINKFLIENED